jgi:hypothetical protein
MAFYRETFDEEKEPEGMVITGDLSSLNSTDASAQPSTAAPSKVENGHAEEEEDDDVVMVEPVPKAATAGTKRKLDEEDSQPTEKRLRATEAVPIEV